jgi:hypothetical protein
MAFYAQHNSEGESETVRQRRLIADRHKRMKEWMNVLCTRLEIWERNGPSESLRQGIAEAAAEWGALFREIMGSDAPRITGQDRDG